MKNTLSHPKNCKAQVLYTLIKKGKVSIEDFPYLSGFRTRVSEIVNQHSLFLSNTNVTGTNQFGRTITYVEHKIDPNQLDTAIQIYNTINK